MGVLATVFELIYLAFAGTPRVHEFHQILDRLATFLHLPLPTIVPKLHIDVELLVHARQRSVHAAVPDV